MIPMEEIDDSYIFFHLKLQLNVIFYSTNRPILKELCHRNKTERDIQLFWPNQPPFFKVCQGWGTNPESSSFVF